jgi:uroporphyrinogen-III decarboxylase
MTPLSDLHRRSKRTKLRIPALLVLGHRLESVPIAYPVCEFAHNHVLCVTGKPDPCKLLVDPEAVRRRTTATLRDGADLPGHIPNLGPAIFPETPVDNAIAFVETVKNFRS